MPLLHSERTVRAHLRTLDSFCADKKIDHIDILKIDAQGMEGAVLKGAGTMLAEGRIGLVYLEILVAPTYEGQSDPGEIFSGLSSSGYRLADFFDEYRNPAGQLLQFDALFSRRV